MTKKPGAGIAKTIIIPPKTGGIVVSGGVKNDPPVVEVNGDEVRFLEE